MTTFEISLQEVALIEHWRSWKENKETNETFLLRLNAMMEATKRAR